MFSKSAYTTGATKSSVPGLQNSRISLKRYSLRVLDKPGEQRISGISVLLGSLIPDFIKLNGISSVSWATLQYTIPGES